MTAKVDIDSEPPILTELEVIEESEPKVVEDPEPESKVEEPEPAVKDLLLRLS